MRGMECGLWFATPLQRSRNRIAKCPLCSDSWDQCCPWGILNGCSLLGASLDPLPLQAREVEWGPSISFNCEHILLQPEGSTRANYPVEKPWALLFLYMPDPARTFLDSWCSDLHHDYFKLLFLNISCTSTIKKQELPFHWIYFRSVFTFLEGYYYFLLCLWIIIFSHLWLWEECRSEFGWLYPWQKFIKEGRIPSYWISSLWILFILGPTFYLLPPFLSVAFTVLQLLLYIISATVWPLVVDILYYTLEKLYNISVFWTASSMPNYILFLLLW